MQVLTLILFHKCVGVSSLVDHKSIWPAGWVNLSGSHTQTHTDTHTHTMVAVVHQHGNRKIDVSDHEDLSLEAEWPSWFGQWSAWAINDCYPLPKALVSWMMLVIQLFCGCVGSTYTTGRRKSRWALIVERHTQPRSGDVAWLSKASTGVLTDDIWWCIGWQFLKMGIWNDVFYYFPSLNPTSQDPLNSLGVSSTLDGFRCTSLF